ncbi:hypothetical protein DFH27DRAFT_84518 [Peziza echinospora]|nr:hypothetical protein DFH27DRAFT_84518 [Peziza echinospora]
MPSESGGEATFKYPYFHDALSRAYRPIHHHQHEPASLLGDADIIYRPNVDIWLEDTPGLKFAKNTGNKATTTVKGVSLDVAETQVPAAKTRGTGNSPRSVRRSAPGRFRCHHPGCGGRTFRDNSALSDHNDKLSGVKVMCERCLKEFPGRGRDVLRRHQKTETCKKQALLRTKCNPPSPESDQRASGINPPQISTSSSNTQHVVYTATQSNDHSQISYVDSRWTRSSPSTQADPFNENQSNAQQAQPSCFPSRLQEEELFPSCPPVEYPARTAVSPNDEIELETFPPTNAMDPTVRGVLNMEVYSFEYPKSTVKSWGRGYVNIIGNDDSQCILGDGEAQAYNMQPIGQPLALQHVQRLSYNIMGTSSPNTPARFETVQPAPSHPVLHNTNMCNDGAYAYGDAYGRLYRTIVNLNPLGEGARSFNHTEYRAGQADIAVHDSYDQSRTSLSFGMNQHIHSASDYEATGNPSASSFEPHGSHSPPSSPMPNTQRLPYSGLWWGSTGHGHTSHP